MSLLPQEPSLQRTFTFRSALALAFAFVSPIIGVYTIFGMGLALSGPSFWWAILIALAGQTLVALTFAELASIWPLAGGSSQWARRLGGPTYGWAAGWAYISTLVVATAAAPYVASTFVAAVVGVDSPSTTMQILLALPILAVATIGNLFGRRLLKLFLGVSLGAEIAASLVLGLVLLLFFRDGDLSVVTDGVGQAPISASGLLAAVGVAGFAFIGFESAGAIAEETRDPHRAVPRAMVLALLGVGTIVALSCLALLLAAPAGVLTGGSGTDDPIVATLTAQLGDGVTRPFLLAVVLGFVAGTMAGQAAVSRAVFAMAREGVLPASRTLARLSGPDRLPRHAIAVVTAAACGLLLLTYEQSAFATLVTLTAGGFYVAYAFPVIAATWQRHRGRHPEPRGFSLGRGGPFINGAASLWLLAEFVNIAWPRNTEVAWYQNWGVPIVVCAFAALGVAVYLSVRTQLRSAEDLADADARRLRAGDAAHGIVPRPTSGDDLSILAASVRADD